MKTKEPLKLKFYFAVWLPLSAHVDGVSHWLQGHRTTFIGSVDLWSGFLGDISCEECPETSMEDGKHVGLSIWCRHSSLIMHVGQAICGLLGHRELKHPTRGEEPVLDQWYCSRCMGHVEPTDGSVVREAIASGHHHGSEAPSTNSSISSLASEGKEEQDPLVR